MDGAALPHLLTDLPGPRSRAQVDVLARHECPAVTARRARRAEALGAADDDPIVWAEALGSNVRDVDGNVLVDLTAGFGVALVGHRHPRVVQAVRAQADRLLHAMGDAWPDAARIALLERLAGVLPDPLSVLLLGLSGSDAVDGAVKTAVLHTGRHGVLAFEGAYHGLALGVLALQGYKPSFSEPFRPLLAPAVRRLPYGAERADVDQALADGTIGLILVEPMLGRGGTRPAPEGWLAMLRALADRHGALLAFDEVLTGCGRTGTPFLGPAEGVVPDLMCVGKALGGGLPISACAGSAQVMASWGPSRGEALHTQTFLGHPPGCAAAVAVLDLLEGDLCARVGERGEALRAALGARGFGVRGRGLLLAVELGAADALAASRELMRRGWLTLPADAHALQLTPPVTLSDAQIEAFAETLGAVA
ncbi:MAG: aspartate aminotransferase family protein [Myxococcales bacterium]|nr:aspartate aminotransferase family protein [Myxococcales bacterium]